MSKRVTKKELLEANETLQRDSDHWERLAKEKADEVVSLKCKLEDADKKLGETQRLLQNEEAERRRADQEKWTAEGRLKEAREAHKQLAEAFAGKR